MQNAFELVAAVTAHEREVIRSRRDSVTELITLMQTRMSEIERWIDPPATAVPPGVVASPDARGGPNVSADIRLLSASHATDAAVRPLVEAAVASGRVRAPNTFIGPRVSLSASVEVDSTGIRQLSGGVLSGSAVEVEQLLAAAAGTADTPAGDPASPSPSPTRLGSGGAPPSGAEVRVPIRVAVQRVAHTLPPPGQRHAAPNAFVAHHTDHEQSPSPSPARAPPLLGPSLDSPGPRGAGHPGGGHAADPPFPSPPRLAASAASTTQPPITAVGTGGASVDTTSTTYAAAQLRARLEAPSGTAAGAHGAGPLGHRGAAVHGETERAGDTGGRAEPLAGGSVEGSLGAAYASPQRPPPLDAMGLGDRGAAASGNAVAVVGDADTATTQHAVSAPTVDTGSSLATFPMHGDDATDAMADATFPRMRADVAAVRAGSPTGAYRDAMGGGGPYPPPHSPKRCAPLLIRIDEEVVGIYQLAAPAAFCSIGAVADAAAALRTEGGVSPRSPSAGGLGSSCASRSPRGTRGATAAAAAAAAATAAAAWGGIMPRDLQLTGTMSATVIGPSARRVAIALHTPHAALGVVYSASTAAAARAAAAATAAARAGGLGVEDVMIGGPVVRASPVKLVYHSHPSVSHRDWKDANVIVCRNADGSVASYPLDLPVQLLRWAATKCSGRRGRSGGHSVADASPSPARLAAVDPSAGASSAPWRSPVAVCLATPYLRTAPPAVDDPSARIRYDAGGRVLGGDAGATYDCTVSFRIADEVVLRSLRIVLQFRDDAWPPAVTSSPPGASFHLSDKGRTMTIVLPHGGVDPTMPAGPVRKEGTVAFAIPSISEMDGGRGDGRGLVAVATIDFEGVGSITGVVPLHARGYDDLGTDESVPPSPARDCVRLWCAAPECSCLLASSSPLPPTTTVSPFRSRCRRRYAARSP